MQHSKYVIIGGGMTADAAVRGIREVDPTGSVTLISAEADPPYDRPPLSKKLWKGAPLDSVWRRTEDTGAVLRLERRVRTLNLGERAVADDRGEVFRFERLLLATGARPKRLPWQSQAIYFRTLEDYRRLRLLAETDARFAVIGGGFIGSEIAAALAMNGKKVLWVFPEATACARVLPRGLGLFLNDYYRDKGVEVLAGTNVVSIEQQDDKQIVRLRDPLRGEDRTERVDAVVAGIGVEPAVELARSAGLAVEDGIIVDDLLRAGHPDVFAAGDVALYPDPVFGGRRRFEHEDNANSTGLSAGRALAGEAAPYRHQSFFYSDLFELGYEAVGDLDAGMETTADWREPYREGVVYYHREGQVRGVLLWNVWEQVDAARRLIAERRTFRPADLRGRLPE